jgi:hypothetical protein
MDDVQLSIESRCVNNSLAGGVLALEENFASLTIGGVCGRSHADGILQEIADVGTKLE